LSARVVLREADPADDVRKDDEKDDREKREGEHVDLATLATGRVGA
jgi:hypothetical protein